jgi:hypothetical protein
MGISLFEQRIRQDPSLSVSGGPVALEKQPVFVPEKNYRPKGRSRAINNWFFVQQGWLAMNSFSSFRILVCLAAVLD